MGEEHQPLIQPDGTLPQAPAFPEVPELPQLVGYEEMPVPGQPEAAPVMPIAVNGEEQPAETVSVTSGEPQFEVPKLEMPALESDSAEEGPVAPLAQIVTSGMHHDRDPASMFTDQGDVEKPATDEAPIEEEAASETPESEPEDMPSVDEIRELNPEFIDGITVGKVVEFREHYAESRQVLAQTQAELAEIQTKADAAQAAHQTLLDGLGLAEVDGQLQAAA